MSITNWSGATKAYIIILLVSFFAIVIAGLAIDLSLLDRPGDDYKTAVLVMGSITAAVVVISLILVVVDFALK